MISRGDLFLELEDDEVMESHDRSHSERNDTENKHLIVQSLIFGR